MGSPKAELGINKSPQYNVDLYNAGVNMMRDAGDIQRGLVKPIEFAVPEELRGITGADYMPVVELKIAATDREAVRQVAEGWESKTEAERVIFFQGPAGHVDLIATGKVNGTIEDDAQFFVPYSPESPTTTERAATVLNAVAHKLTSPAK